MGRLRNRGSPQESFLSYRRHLVRLVAEMIGSHDPILRLAREKDVAALIALAKRSWLSGFASAPAAFVRERVARDFENEWYWRYWPDMTVAEDGGALLGVVQP